MKFFLTIFFSIYLMACSTLDASQDLPQRKLSSNGCTSFLKGIVSGYEVDDYGVSSKREDSGPLMNGWTSAELETLVVPLRKYKNLSTNGKKKLKVNIEIYSYNGKKTLKESYSEWEKWPRKNNGSDESYMKVKGLNLKRIFGRLIHPLYERFTLGKSSTKKTAPKKENLPHKVIISLYNNKESLVCAHTITLDLEDRH